MGLEFLVPLLLIVGMAYFMLIRPENQKRAAQKAMLDAMSKNDRVVTIGGIRGTVVSVRRDADEVTLKVDENTKLRMTLGSIARVESQNESKGEIKNELEASK